MLLSEVCCHEYYREGTGTSHILNYNQLTTQKSKTQKMFMWSRIKDLHL